LDTVRLIAALAYLNRLPKLATAVVLVSAALNFPCQAQLSPAPSPVVAAPAPAAHPTPLASASAANIGTAAAWRSLNTQQQAALQPLQSDWNNLSDQQKRKWLSISANFPRMAVGEQTKLHERMAQWAALSPRQREVARLNYGEVQKMSPQQKNEKWEAYQALTPTDKQKLAAAAQPTPPRTALAIQPAPPGKIHQLPPSDSSNHARLPLPMTGVSNNTLLVKPVAPNRPASAPANVSSKN
jgi:hypothetical protein